MDSIHDMNDVSNVDDQGTVVDWRSALVPAQVCLGSARGAHASLCEPISQVPALFPWDRRIAHYTAPAPLAISRVGGVTSVSHRAGMLTDP